MSAPQAVALAPPTAPAPPALGFCATLLALMNILARSATSGCLVIHARSGSGSRHLLLPVAAAEGPALPELPPMFLDMLEEHPPWSLLAPLAVFDSNGQAPQSLAAVFARFDLTVQFGHTSGEAPARYYVRAEDQARVAAAIAGFSLRPSVIIDGARCVVALWVLETPIGINQALPLQRALATRLDATTADVTMGTPSHAGGPGRTWTLPGDHPGAMIPLAGSVPDMGKSLPTLVDVPLFTSARYAVKEIHAALRPATPPGKKGAAIP